MFPLIVLSIKKGQILVVGGWRVGSNPSSVLCGIQLSGLPASFAEVMDAYLPLHPAGQPFHRFHPSPQ